MNKEKTLIQQIIEASLSILQNSHVENGTVEIYTNNPDHDHAKVQAFLDMFAPGKEAKMFGLCIAIDAEDDRMFLNLWQTWSQDNSGHLFTAFINSQGDICETAQTLEELLAKAEKTPYCPGCGNQHVELDYPMPETVTFEMANAIVMLLDTKGEYLLTEEYILTASVFGISTPEAEIFGINVSPAPTLALYVATQPQTQQQIVATRQQELEQREIISSSMELFEQALTAQVKQGDTVTVSVAVFEGNPDTPTVSSIFDVMQEPSNASTAFGFEKWFNSFFNSSKQ